MAVAVLIAVVGSSAGAGRALAQDESDGLAPLAGSGCDAGWRDLPLPESAQRTRPYEIVVDDGRLAWVVGGSDGGPLVLRRDDDGWTHLKSASKRLADDAPAALLDAIPGEDGSLQGVGYVRPERGIMEPYAGRAGGQRWKERRVRGLPGPRVALAGIAPRGNGRAWAVGTTLEDGRTRAFAVRWNGRRWITSDVAPNSRESALTAATDAQDGSVWAVGWRTTKAGPKRPFVLRIAKDGPKRAVVPELPAGTAVLTDVTDADTGDIWATGYLVAEGTSRYRPFVARWDGQGWSTTTVPLRDDASAIPRSMAIAADGTAWLAGTLLSGDTVESEGFIFSAQDPTSDAWRLHDELPLADGRAELYSVAATGDGVVVSGNVAGQAVVLETCSGPDGAATPRAESIARSGASAGAAAGSDSSKSTPVAATDRLARAVKPKGFRLRDMSEAAGLGMVMHTLSGMARDLDVDGWDDLLIWSHGDPVVFLHGGPDGFEPGRSGVFGDVDRHVCTSADVDGDDRLDVFCSVGRARGSAIDRHELSLAPGYPDGGLAPDLLGIEDPFGRGRSATFIQLDGDGLPDLFVSNSPDRGDALPGTSRFYRNVGGRFAAAPEVGQDVSTGGDCAVAADIDGDGDEDLLHCQVHADDGRDAGLRIHRNDDGVLTERSRKLGIEPIGDIDVIVTDMTGDGRADIVQLSRDRLRISRGTRKGTFKRSYEVRTPFAMGMAVGDVDGDGTGDIYVVAGSKRGNETDLLLVNDGRGRSFTSVRIPQGREGSGADVLALDYDQNGLTDFVVLDGRGSVMGPVRLLASFPRG